MQWTWHGKPKRINGQMSSLAKGFGVDVDLDCDVVLSLKNRLEGSFQYMNLKKKWGVSFF